MKRLLVVSSLVLCSVTGSAFAQSFTGVVSDAMCAKNPVKASSPDHAACAKKCIDGGSPAVLIVAGKVYPVANPDKLSSYAGKTVTVDGKLSDGTITVDTVK